MRFLFLLPWLVWFLWVSFPFLLTLINLIFLFIPTKEPWVKMLSITVDWLAMSLGGFLLCMLNLGDKVSFWGWFSFLPGDFLPGFCWSLVFLAVPAWLLLWFVSPEKMPRWVAILCIAVICAGFVPCLMLYGRFVAALSLNADRMAFYLLLPPLNCVFIGAKAIRDYFQEKK